MDLDQSSPRSGLGTAPNPAREAVAAAAVQDYLQLATRENTRRSYASAVRHFEVEWGGLLPATTDGVVRYVANYGATLSANTLQLRLSALARWHVDQGFPDPTRHPMVSTGWTVARRSSARGARLSAGAGSRHCWPASIACTSPSMHSEPAAGSTGCSAQRNWRSGRTRSGRIPAGSLDVQPSPASRLKTST